MNYIGQIKSVLKAISYPMAVTLSSFIPKLNYEFLFTHGGLGWLLVALSFPWVLGVIIIDFRKKSDIESENRIVSGFIILMFYFAFSLPLAFLLQKGIMTIGITMEFKEAWKFYGLPFTLLL